MINTLPIILPSPRSPIITSPLLSPFTHHPPYAQGEGWRGFMHDAMIEEPECTRTDDFDNCGYPVGAVLYFVTYIIAMGYIFTNLFVAAMMKSGADF